MQERPKAIIAGFGCQPASPDYLRLLSADITEGWPKRNLGTEALSRGEPKVESISSSGESRAKLVLLHPRNASAARLADDERYFNLLPAVDYRLVPAG